MPNIFDRRRTRQILGEIDLPQDDKPQTWLSLVEQLMSVVITNYPEMKYNDQFSSKRNYLVSKEKIYFEGFLP